MMGVERNPGGPKTAPTLIDHERDGRDDRQASTPPPSSRALPGLDRYEDLGVIGAGGMGEVRRVHDRLMGRALAMKILSWRLADSAEAREAFLHEARITSNLQHPGIVAVHDVGVLADGRPWYTMKEVRGRTFLALVEQLHREQSSGTDDDLARGLTQVVEMLISVCDALAYAHGRGVIHRDLKPANLMVGRFGEVQVMDWGLALDLNGLASSGHSSPAAAAEPAPAAPAAEQPAAEQPAAEQPGDPFMSVALSRVRPGAQVDSDKISGTLAYMSPEQARGEPLRSASDVYALGAVLYETTAGKPPYSGSGRKIWAELLAGPAPPPLTSLPPSPLRPAELCAIAERAMRREPNERYRDAGELADALRAWLQSRRSERRAMDILQRADTLWPRITELRSEARELRRQAEQLLVEVQPFDPLERKRPAWRLQEQAADRERTAAVQEVAWQQLVRSALNEVPDLGAAHKRLADHYRQRLETAEAARDREAAARAEALLSNHDRGEHSAYLRGDSTLTLTTEPPGAELSLYRYRLEDRVLRTELVAELGPAPLSDHVLPWGSYLLVARAPDHHEVRYPIQLPRGGAWQALRPGDDAPTPLWLPPKGAFDIDDVYIPAGWFMSGGGAAAIEPLPRKLVWIDGFVMQRHPVTRAEYLAYLNALLDEGREQEALRRAPKKPLGNETERSDEPLWPRDEHGRFQLDPGYDDPDQARWPVSLIDWHDARSYARWLNRERDLGWRLPSELEWEKAARGVDGRALPWGEHFDPTFACVVGSHSGKLRPFAVDAFPYDESVYGVHGLAGNVRDWCIERWERDGPPLADDRLTLCPAAEDDGAFRSVRGGAWTAVVEHGRLASRFAVKPRDRYRGLGFRLVRPLGPKKLASKGDADGRSE